MTDKPTVTPITADDAQAKSADIIAANLETLQSLFPDVVTEDGVNVDVLNQIIGKTVTDCEEKYGLNWHGKRKARQLALTPSTGTLLPCPDESVDWQTTQNLFIEGDNLEALKLLQRSYANKVKLVYIDPPYNTEGDFIYPDRYQDNLDTYLRYTGQMDDDGFKMTSNTESSGRKHANWLSMMFPRVKMARNMLTPDGIFVSHIDEHEFAHMTCLMDEVFGSENNLGPIVWDKRNPKGDATKVATQHEYMIVYAKNLGALRESHEIKRAKANAERMLDKAASLFAKIGTSQVPEDLAKVAKKYEIDLDSNMHSIKYGLNEAESEFQEWLKTQDVSGGEAAYQRIDEAGEVFQTVSMAWPNKLKAPDDYFIPLIHPVTGKPCPVPARGWRNPPGTMKKLLDAERIVFGSDESTQPRRKYLLRENMDENVPSVLPFGGSDDARLKALGIPFDNPKPTDFAKSLLQYCLGDCGIVMDFFAGSATTGHACMELNVDQGAAHRFILVQLPEHLDPKKKEQKAGHKFCVENGLSPTIAEVAKERLRRAGVKVQSANPLYEGDVGFRTFKLDTSNIRAWNPAPEDLEGTLSDHTEHLDPDRDNVDVLYELLLKLGLDLSVPIESKTLDGKEVYAIGAGTLIACLSKEISRDDVEALAQGIIAWHTEFAPEGETTIVFRDGGFADDVVKSNLAAILVQAGFDETRIRSL